MKKGDKVRMKKGLRVGKDYGDIELNKYMRFKGSVELTEPTTRGNYYINGWYYSPEMLEQVKTDTL